MNKKLYAVILFLGLSLLVSPACAGVIWNNGAWSETDFLGGSWLSNAIVADDFMVTSTTNLTGVTFQALEGERAYADSIWWAVYADNSGSPGTLIASGLEIAPSIDRIGTSTLPFARQVDEFFIAISVPGVAPGTYWLALHNGDLADISTRDFYWAWTAPGGVNAGTNRGFSSYWNSSTPGWDPFFANEAEHAFSVIANAPDTGTPEPATLGMVGAGLLLAGFLRRKKR